jgi:hypothetical protein
MPYLIALAVIASCCVLNRVRGGGILPLWPLPGRPLYVVSPLIGLVSWALWPWQIALCWIAAYVVWAVWAWGMIFDLGRQPDGYGRGSLVSKDPVEGLAMAMSFGSDHLAMFWRHLMILPGLALVGYFAGNLWFMAAAPLFSAAVVGAYETGWRVAPANPIRLAELLTGVLWGGLIVGLHYA